MASIAKLAVILSAVTKPLEDGLKGAQSKVSSFGKGIKHGAGIGLGVLGLDKIEGAMKKALQASPELGDAAERVELAFGRSLVSLTGMSQWLPKLATFMDEAASRFSDDNMSQTFESDAQRIQSIWMKITGSSDQEILARVNAMQKEYESAKLLEKAAEKRAAIEAKIKKEKIDMRFNAVAGTTDMFEFLDQLRNANAAVNPDQADANKLAGFKAIAGGSYVVGRIEEELQLKKVIEQNKIIEEERKKIVEEGKALVSANLTPLEKLSIEQDKYNKYLAAGAIDMNTYNRAIKALTPGLKEVEDIQKEIFKLENGELAAKLKDMKEGGASDSVLKEYEKEFNRLEKMKQDMAEMAKEDELEPTELREQSEPKFASAVEAGSAEAYSAAIRAQASLREEGMLAVNRNQLQVSKQQWEIQKQILKAQGDATKAFEASKPFARMTLGGAN